jgi:pilus assembly protein CpaE
MPARVLIVSPNLEFNTFLEQALEEASESSALETLDAYPKASEIKEIVGYNPPGAVIVGCADRAAAFSTLRRFRRASAGLPLIAVHHEHDAALARESRRAGAEGFFAPPIDIERLRSMVFGLAPAQASGQTPGALLAFVPARGGDGASTLALHVAQALSRLPGSNPESASSPTLMVDFDFHAGASAFRLKLHQGPSILDALRLKDKLESKWRGLPMRWKGLDLLVAPDGEPTPAPELFHGLPDFFEFARLTYRFVVVDMPPALYASSRDVLRLSDQVFVVHTPEVVSRAHADRRSAEILNLGLAGSRVHAILNRADSKTPRAVEGVFMGHGLRQFASVRNDYNALQDAELGGRLADDKSKLGQDALALAKRISGELLEPKLEG